MISYDYSIPERGLGTDFSEAERPITYAAEFKNRYVNLTGGAEARQGCTQIGDTIAGLPNLTQIHEYVSKDGVETLMASANGNIYRLSGATWSQVLSGKDSSSRILSVQMQDKLCFFNGVDRNFYTDDGGNSFKELLAKIATGETAGGTNSTTLIDGNISNWINDTNVAVNDIVFNTTVSAYGVVTAVASAALTHSVIGVSGLGSGIAASNPTSGQNYVVIDHVDLNIIPAGSGKDNVATAGTGTTTTVVAVSGVNFANTEIKVGDFIRNTTRNAVGMVTSVSANVNVPSITGQTSGDSLVFLKSGMPIASYGHVHFGRLAMIDARDKNRVVFSAPDDPEDVTTFSKTLDSSSFQFGSQQPRGDTLIALNTFKNFFVAFGKKYIYLFQGNAPIRDTSSSTLSFVAINAYPNGCVSRFSTGSNGDTCFYISPDGLQAFNVGSDNLTTLQNNASLVIRSQFRDLVRTTSEDDVQVSFYPRRFWVICKVGSQVYNLNGTPILNEQGELEAKGSWSLFDGIFAQQNHYFVRRNGDLVGAGNGGKVYLLDADNVYTDAGQTYQRKMTTPWYRLEEPQRSIRVKDGKYIAPIFESTGGIVYTIQAVAGFDAQSSDSIQVTAQGGSLVGSAVIGTALIGAGTGIQRKKYPLRWRGVESQFTITSETSAGPDVVAGYTVYGNIYGRK